MKTNPFLVHVGIETSRFNANWTPRRSIVGEYIVVQKPKTGLTQLILTRKRYHIMIPVLLSYMHDRYLSSILINGGGDIDFLCKGECTNPDDPSALIRSNRIILSDFSFPFGISYPPEVKILVGSIWPDFEIISFMDTDPAVRTMSETGKLFTYDDIKNFNDHRSHSSEMIWNKTDI